MVDVEGDDADILDRFDFELEDLVDKDKFSKALTDKLQVRQIPQASQGQIDAFFDVFDLTKTKFPDAGITKITFERLGRVQTRFTIEGQRGLFGIQKALEFFRRNK